MPGPTDLGLLFTQQSGGFTAPYIEPETSPWGDIARAISGGVTGIGESRARAATAAEARQRALDLEAYRTARTALGELIAGQFRNDPSEVKARMAAEGTGVTGDAALGTMRFDPNPDQVLGEQRDIAAEHITPEFIANVLAQRVQAGDGNAAGGDIGALLGVLATGAADPDRQAGFRGQTLTPGQSVTQSGAQSNFETQEANDIAMNDADAASQELAARIVANATIGSANIRAGVDREQMALTREEGIRADQQARAERLDQQTLSAAVDSALGIRRGDEVRMPEQMRVRILARTTELMRSSEALDATTAATIAIDELTTESPEGGGFWRDLPRTFRYTDEGEAYRPSAPSPPPAPAAPPSGAQVDENGVVYDAQGRVIGRVHQ